MPQFDYTTRASPHDRRLRVIYLWEIRDSSRRVVYRYVGKTERGTKPRSAEYRRIVQSLLDRKPNYVGRQVHRELAKATRKGLRIQFAVLYNIPGRQNIYAVERQYQKQYGCGAYQE